MASVMKSTIVGIIHRFAKFATTTAKGIRVNFPRTHARVFCDELGDVLNSVKADKNIDALDQLLAFLYSIRTSIETLKGLDGIRAMCTFLNVLVSFLDTVFSQQAIIVALEQENEELKIKVDSLEKEINRMEVLEGNTSVDSLETSFSGKLTLDNPVQDPLLDFPSIEWLAGAIPIIGSRDIRVLTAYLAVPRDKTESGKSSCLVVIYEDCCADGVGWTPPVHQAIHWQCVNNCKSCFEDGLFSDFCSKCPVAFENLIIDFFDQNCVSLLTKFSDTTCVYPSVRLTEGGSYEPVLMVGVLCCAYRPANESTLPSSLTTASGRAIPVVLCEGLMLEECHGEITQGFGISTKNNFRECGSIAGIVCKKSDKSKYFVTCEHVLEGLVQSISAGETVVNISIPSVQARKCSLLNVLNAEDRSKFFVQPLDGVVFHSASEELKRKLSLSAESPVLLEDIRQFLYSDHYEFPLDLSTTINFSQQQFSVTPIQNQPAVELTGDIGLIPVPQELANGLKFPHTKVVTFSEVIGFMMRKQEIKVYLHGAASGSPDTKSPRNHTLINLIHMKQRRLQNENMKYASSSLFGRVLLGQYMITGQDFGNLGDSGGLVSLETSSGRQIVGIFVGSVDGNTRTKFVATPAQLLLSAQYEFSQS